MMRSLLLLALAAALCTCTDPIELTTDFETPELVVDAWLTNTSEPQTIRLTQSQDYYANRLPAGVTDAEVVVCLESGTACYPFVHQDSGRYVWTPQPGETIGAVGDQFVLGIRQGGVDYASRTTMNRVPPIDSIAVRLEEERLGLDEGRYAQLYARDFTGVGDAYLVRTTINDTLLNLPRELNLVYDATFDAGSGTDGIVFIAPIRFNINKLDEAGSFIPLETDDRIEVEIWSLSQEAFFFLSVARDQIQNGDNGIFQIPVANSPGNVINLATEQPALGVFNVAAVSAASKTVE
ncbi:hypothetical protein LEM8419_00065 [Neolewinella maritima]|uniref:DUF4249 family protein n=1 Tax=Neolewinella maritima TaxID=1383882 RepID=A0ABM9AVQ4_9BACT|nr:DUF4249 domain-containing protein [Neolewinella maritima]CAH0998719.1 hypothetical protein LEM8419_00065 [Neolewinella maritima]